MCKKLCFLISFILVLTLAPKTYGIVIGDFEDSNDGWVLMAAVTEGSTIDYNDTVGVTLNNRSLKLWVPIGEEDNTWWIEALQFNLLADPNLGLVDEFFNNDTFSMDVTRLVPDWPPTETWEANAFILVVNGGSDLGDFWGDVGDSEYWWTTMPDANLPRTITWDYSGVKDEFDPNSVTFLEFLLILKTANYTEGTYYFDNIQLLSTTPAHGPNPADGAIDVPWDTILSWVPGVYTDTHDVYLGTDFNDVNDASIGNDPCGVLMSQDQEPNFYNPGGLEFGTTYYWRVDEVNEAHIDEMWKGPVWSFTTANYIVVDDMESYNGLLPDDPNSNNIWCVWKEGFGYGSEQYPPIYCGNGTGSSIGDINTDSYTEETIVHGGGQSMPYYYDNTATGRNWCDEPITLFYSETERTFDGPQDWTAEGVKALTLWFYGDPNNDANATEQLYVKVNGVKKLYDGNMDDIREIIWHEWTVDLTDFNGVDPNSVATLAIGFGDEDNTTMPGGSGKVYFDDIRLYLSRCVPARGKPVGDLNNDCEVGYADLAVVAGDWLVTDYNANPLMAWYKLDDGSGTTAVDSSANGNNGTLEGSPVWVVTGQVNGALQFDDGNDYVDLGDDELFNPTGSFSIALWAYIEDWSQEWSHVMISRRGEWGVGWQLRRNGAWWGLGAADGICFSTGGVGHAGTAINDTPTDAPPPLNQWVHIAAVYDSTNSKKRIYIDGVEQVEYATDPWPINPTTHNVYLGARANADNDGQEAFFTGMLDDVRLYDKALLQEEIASVMGGGEGSVSHYHPVVSPAELYEAEPQGSKVINFMDFAIWAQTWLDEQMWP